MNDLLERGPFTDIAETVGGPFAEAVGSGTDARTTARALLAELSRPAVVVVEDLHWADEATLDVVRMVGRRVD